MRQISNPVKNFTLFVLILILSFNTQIKGQTPAPTPLNVAFTSIPTLISGAKYEVGAKYKFLNVATNVNAIVTIVSSTGGATVSTLDDNTTSKPEAFSPIIEIPANSNGLVTFKIEYFNAIVNGGTKAIDNLAVTAYDIDGTDNLNEVDALDLGLGGTVSYLSNSLEIKVVQSGSLFTATNIAGINYPGVDTSAKQVMFTVTNANVSSFIYKAGANNKSDEATPRLFAIYFKAFNYAPAATALLPVKYLSFTGTVVNKSVVLNWVTAQEINNNYFQIERSFTGKDFVSIGIAIDGFANGTKKEYAFKDNSALSEDKEVVYYCLKQFDNDGKFSYSTILVVRIKPISKLDIQVSPNPFIERLTIKFIGIQNSIANVRIVNLSGQSVISKKTDISKGYNNIEVDGLNSLPRGTYLATIVVNGNVICTQKIVK